MSYPAAPFLSMTSPLGPKALIPTAFGLEEALSQPFTGVIDLVSEQEKIDPFRLLHQPVCVSLSLPGKKTRKVHGLVRHFAATGPLSIHGVFSYRAEIVPRLWFLSQTEDCRIFEKKTTKEIVETVLKDHDVPVTFRTADTPGRPFTMQYNESGLDFVSRLLQEEGWFYFFSDEDCLGEKLEKIPAGSVIVSDRITSLGKSDLGRVKLGSSEDADVLASWQPGRTTSHGKVRQEDYDPEHPDTPLNGEARTTQPASGASARNAYHWPALVLKQDDAALRARHRMEAAEVEAALAHGTGFNPGFTAGSRIEVTEGFNATAFVLHSVSHQVTDETWRNAPDRPSYSNSFTAFPAKMLWRPARTIRRPRMEGIYSGTVMGPEGQEIHTDELGRVKVKFRWDHRSDATASDGAWVRVMQAWAGANAGWSFIPRVGTEVAISFMDGDPDRPVVIGQFHNGNEKPPWSLPGHKTRSGLRSRSTPDGSTEECSEFWFDDKKNEEQVMLHAQRDLTIEAENDATHDVGHNRTVTVHKGNDKLTVEQGDRVVDVPQGNHTIRSTSGDIIIKTTAGAVSMEAMKSLTLKVGQSSVTLDPAGVTIKGMMVKVEGQVMTSLKGPMLQLDADGMLKAAGGVMMLN